MKKEVFLLAAFLLLLPVAGCRQKSRFAVDAADYPPVRINRFDRDLVMLDTTDLQAGVRGLYRRYPDFFPVYAAEVMGADPADTALVADYLAEFLRDTAFTAVNRAVMQVYDRTDNLEASLTGAYACLHHYFPELPLPEVCFFVSGFNRSILMTGRLLAMGTDMYLGADFPAYRELTYQYMVNNMKPANIVPDMVSALLFSTFRMDSRQDRLLDHILYRGKVMYLLAVCLPDEADENLIGYTAEQIEWCRRNERRVWASVIDQKHLFSSDRLLVRKYVNDAPFTGTISQDSPGRLGTWLGWQIVRSYMEHNEEVTLPGLMRETDYQKLLEESGYRP